jgi:signal transduction histidine kinase
MVINVLRATQIGGGVVEANMTQLDLAFFLDELKSTYELALNKELTFHWNYSSNLPTVYTDGEKLKLILRNLINNAVKFTEKGTITVEAKITQQATGNRQETESSQQEAEGSKQYEEGSEPLAVSGEQIAIVSQGQTISQRVSTVNSKPKTRDSPQHTADCRLPTFDDQWVEFKVADTGVGMPKESVAIIFDMFRQIDSSESRLYGGVGLGLYIVRKYTEILGGVVKVDSEVGKGTTFTVAIPVRNSSPLPINAVAN